MLNVLMTWSALLSVITGMMSTWQPHLWWHFVLLAAVALGWVMWAVDVTRAVWK